MSEKPLTSTSIRASSNFEKIMTIILEEANAGAFTTQGQFIDRPNELLHIELESGEPPEAAARIEAGLSGCDSQP